METMAWTFWQYLGKNKIAIPIIQRDYAQGRKGKEALRKKFLIDLKESLEEGKPLKLDFVYGARENGAVTPLDGQQRLTTLWLLHWFIAYRACVLKDVDVAKQLGRFTYETRMSSRVFCERLSSFSELPYGNTGVVEHIQNQTWFRNSWKHDPTIQSMLRMLGGSSNDGGYDIESVFGCQYEACVASRKCYYQTYWETLVGDSCPIVFYHLELHGLQQTDDLYIKMNARGKPLTSLENLKADLAGLIEQNKDKAGWDLLADVQKGFAIKMDTDWMDIFWANRSSTNTIDEIYFHFLNRYFFSEVCLAANGKGRYLIAANAEEKNIHYRYLNDSKNPNDYDLKIAYQGLDAYKYAEGILPVTALQKLAKVLDNLHVISRLTNSALCISDSVDTMIGFCVNWDEGFRFIPEYEKDKNGEDIGIKDNADNEIFKTTCLTQVQRVIFFSLCHFLAQLELDTLQENSQFKLKLRRWMRVVRNMVSVHDKRGKLSINSFGAMRSVMSRLAQLDSQRVYESLVRTEVGDEQAKEDSDESALQRQFEEEIQKAKQILKGNQIYDGQLEKYKGKSWETVIEEVEQGIFLKGSIRCLFTNEDGTIDWTQFDNKLQAVERYFDDHGIRKEFQTALIRAFVLLCDDWQQQLSEAQIFNSNASTWKWVFCSLVWRKPVHSILTSKQLDLVKEGVPSQDDNYQKYVRPFFRQFPYRWVVDKEPEGRLHRSGHRWAFYKQYGRDAMMLDWEDFHRNSVLTTLYEEGSIQIDQAHLIPGTCNVFWGWNIVFSYQQRFFQWYGFPVYGLDVYLIDKQAGGTWSHLKRPNYDTTKDGASNYFGFKVDSRSTPPDEFKRKLDALITESLS